MSDIAVNSVISIILVK